MGTSIGSIVILCLVCLYEFVDIANMFQKLLVKVFKKKKYFFRLCV